LKNLENSAAENTGSNPLKVAYINKNIEAAKLDAAGWAASPNARNQAAINFEKVGISKDKVKAFREATDENKVGEALSKIDTELH
jgi:hypothetical protein